MPNNNNNTNNNLDNINVNDIALTDTEVKTMVDNLNVFVKESEKIVSQDRHDAMLNLTSYNEAFVDKKSEFPNLGNDAIEGNLESESLKILEALPINGGDKGVLQAIEKAGLLRRFHDNTITNDLVNSTLNDIKNYVPISSAVSDVDNIENVTLFSMDNGVMSINFPKLWYHSNKIYDL